MSSSNNHETSMSQYTKPKQLGIVQGTFGQRTYGSTELRPTDIGCNQFTKKCISDDTLLRSTAKHLRARLL